MFLARRPSAAAIDRLLRQAQDLPLSYASPLMVLEDSADRRFDEANVTIGSGPADFARARAALLAWKQHELGWVEMFPHRAPVAVGTVVAMLARHLGFWSVNTCRILHTIDTTEPSASRFGFVYGALTAHAVAGEELFELSMDARTGAVGYRIRAVSWPQTALTHIGRPIMRAYQARFRRESAAAMARATHAGPIP
jgi:uncharacterized protein (UPF0548 family)